MIGPHTVFANKVPIYFEDMYVGTVSTFRNKTEIDLLTKELTRVKQYTDALRAQTHEFSNKLSVILGLLQLNKKKKPLILYKRKVRCRKNGSIC